MGMAAEAVAVDDEVPEVDTRWIEDLARQAARRLKKNGGSPGAFLCELESLIRNSYHKGLGDAQAVCDRLEDEARGWHKDGRPRSYPLRPSRCLGAIECSRAIKGFAEKVV